MTKPCQEAAPVGCTRPTSRAPARGRTWGALLAVLAATGCDGQGGTPYGVLHDAGLSADAKTLLVLVEHGTKTTASGSIWRGDITTERPDSVQIHEFDRSSGQPGRVLSHAPPAERSPGGREHLKDYVAKAEAPVTPLKDCRELYTECAATTTPRPYMLGRRVVDPQGGRAIEWDGRRLVVTPFEAMDAAQVRAARAALFRRSVERMHTAAMKDLAARSTSENPERIETGEAGTAERDPGMTAFYRLLPGRIVHARFEYAENRFLVVWERDGTCVTDSAPVAAVVGCHASDEKGVQRAALGVARARPADPDRAGTTWGVIATSDAPDTPSGTATVACHGMPHETGGKPCNAPNGTTACRTSLPLLCSKADASHPAKSPLARRLALTAPVPGTELVSAAGADQICRSQLGEGWKMTEANESGYLYQVTGIGSLAATSRFWVRIGDGPANCW